MNMPNKQYDSDGRLISDYIPETETSYKYEYTFDGRKVIITNEKNRSNHTTIIEQEEDDNGWFRDVNKIEHGDIYTISISYDERGRQLKYEQINKEKNTNFTKTFFYPKDGETHIAIMDYNGNKNIDFKSNIKKLIKKY
jgi:flagellar basal body L-ring protein FlgH